MSVVFSSCIFYVLIFFLISHIRGQIPTQSNEQTGAYDPDSSYCFRFTWLGPEFGNHTIVNTTCVELLDTTRAVNVPCRQPLLITYDGSPPDINYLWKYHRDQILCKRASGQVCAKYSYSFDNKIQNVTYMCTKVSMRGKGAVTSGCYSQTLDEYDIELCVCESAVGPTKPCNGVGHSIVSLGLIIILTFVISFV